MKKITETAGQTRALARTLAGKILKMKPETAVVIGLTGDLGCGKTIFVQGFARALGIKEKITSPTFIVMKKLKILIHIDAYRIKNPKEILDLGWEEMIKNPKNIIIVEWAEKIKKIMPADTLWIRFDHVGQNQRIIEI